jgi:hypothetical protein
MHKYALWETCKVFNVVRGGVCIDHMDINAFSTSIFAYCVFFMNCSISVLQFLRKMIADLQLMLSRLVCRLYSKEIRCYCISCIIIIIIQGDQKVSVHLMITIQKVTVSI